MSHTIIHFIQQGGLMMYPLLIAIFVALTMIVERFFMLAAYTRHIALIDPVSDAIARNDLAEARKNSRPTPGQSPLYFAPAFRISTVTKNYWTTR